MMISMLMSGKRESKKWKEHGMMQMKMEILDMEMIKIHLMDLWKVTKSRLRKNY
jgi:hypothetical protein